MSYSGLGANICAPPLCMVAVPASSAGLTTDFPAANVQRALIAAGFPVGSTGADGIFGTHSESAMHQALMFLMVPDPGFIVSPDRHSVKMNPNVYTAITKIVPLTPTAPQSTPSPSSAPRSTVTTPDATPPPIDTGSGMDWTPWLIGGGIVLAAGGAYLMLSGPKPKATHTVKGHSVKRNTRRTTKRRRTRRTRRARASAKRRRARGTTKRATRRRVRRNSTDYRVVVPHGTVGSGRMSHAEAIESLRRLGGQKKGYRIVGGGIRANGGSARETELDGYAYEYTGTRGHVFDSEDDDWETVMVTHLPGSVIGSRNIDGSRMAIVKAEDGKTYAILWHMMKNRRRA